MIRHASRLFPIFAILVRSALAADPPPLPSLDKKGDKETLGEVSPPENPTPERRFAAWDRDRSGTLDEDEFLESIPEAERLRHRWTFLLRDFSADGRLDLEEWQAKTLSNRVPWKKAFAAHDLDGDGRIGREEYLSLYGSGDRDASQTFVILDFDADGSLTPQEFTHRLGLDISAGEQGSLPDAIAELCDGHLAGWKAALAKADTDKSGGLSAAEWSQLEWGTLASSLGAVSFSEWDRNEDKAVDEAEGERALRIAFGVINTRGEPSRTADGGVINAYHVGRLDKNADGKLAFEEFAEGFERPADENRQRFDAADGDRDGVLDYSEYSAAPEFRHSRVQTFFYWDANQSGRIEQDELALRAAPWQRGMMRTLIAAFDTDGDQVLSFREFDGSPFGHLSSDWYSVPDRDGDARLSWEEFRPTSGIALAGIARHYFDRFDRDRSGFVELAEFEFPVDVARIPTEALFGLRDKNRDGGVDWAELLGRDADAKEDVGSQRSNEARNFRVVDWNGDGRLSLDEFRCLPGQGPAAQRGAVPDPLRDEMEQVLNAALRLFGERTEVPRREWESAVLEGGPPAIAAVSRRAWDCDGDGKVSREDCRKLLEITYGIRDQGGRLIRQDNGWIVNCHSIWNWDRDLSGTLSRSEFVANHWKTSENEAIFDSGDLNHDGKWDWAEIVRNPEVTFDILGQFLWMDTDYDGAIDQEEIDQRAAPWQKSMATRLIAAFDADANHRLSFAEYRRTPFANPLADWYAPKRDADNDSQLSWKEFFDAGELRLLGVWSRFFDAFDRNQDSRLTFDELEFEVDFNKIAPDVAFRIQDKNADGKLVLREVFEESKPTTKDREALERYEMRLATAETRLLADDKDRDGSLSLAEFQQSRDAALATVERKTKALTRHRSESGGDWFYPVVLTVNAIVLLGGGWYLYRRST